MPVNEHPDAAEMDDKKAAKLIEEVLHNAEAALSITEFRDLSTVVEYLREHSE